MMSYDCRGEVHEKSYRKMSRAEWVLPAYSEVLGGATDVRSLGVSFLSLGDASELQKHAHPSLPLPWGTWCSAPFLLLKSCQSPWTSGSPGLVVPLD